MLMEMGKWSGFGEEGRGRARGERRLLGIDKLTIFWMRNKIVISFAFYLHRGRSHPKAE